MPKYLVIVESPAKAKTIKKFLGRNYEVIASNGHVRDLPKSTLGIDIENDFEPKYITIRGKGEVLAIARAVARDPEIYIFDDSFSALDYKTDSVLRKELKNYTKDATSLIVAQRIGTIMNADKIIVLDDGKCVGQGTHKELLKNCEVYKQIALSQLSKEELENG